MDLVLPTHRENLQKMIGCSIAFGLMPKLEVGASAVYPDSAMYGVGKGKYYESFYRSYLLNLRMVKENGARFWITMAPGPDASIEPWAPFWVEASKACDYGDIQKDYSFYKNVYGTEPSKEEDKRIEQENRFMDSHVFGFGLNRLSKWFQEEKIIQIELFDYAPYVACIVQHSSGKEWCVYAEYDFEFWINFSQDMGSNIRAYGELVEVIE